jgi:hypothetical protein
MVGIKKLFLQEIPMNQFGVYCTEHISRMERDEFFKDKSCEVKGYRTGTHCILVETSNDEITDDTLINSVHPDYRELVKSIQVGFPR